MAVIWDSWWRLPSSTNVSCTLLFLGRARLVRTTLARRLGARQSSATSGIMHAVMATAGAKVPCEQQHGRAFTKGMTDSNGCLRMQQRAVGFSLEAVGVQCSGGGANRDDCPHARAIMLN